MTIGEKLRAARGEMSRAYVASECGISVSSLGMYETDQRVPRDEVKVKLAKLYHKTVEELFFAHIGHE